MAPFVSLLRSVAPLLLSVLSLLCLLQPLPSALAAQAVCDNGVNVLPCPAVSRTYTEWGISWRNYSAVGIAGKGIFNSPGAVLDTLRTGVPVVEAYFHGANADKAVLNQTIPVGVLMQSAGNQTAYLVFFFLPDAYVAKPPAFTNATGFIHLNSWPTATASFNPIVYSFLDRATDANIAANLALLEAQLQAHKQTYFQPMTAFITYSAPHADLQQSEVWYFESNPFPAHDLLTAHHSPMASVFAQ